MPDESRAYEDHDQRFKIAVQEFFAEFLALAMPHWSARVDFSKVEWLDKEAFPPPPAGERGIMDLVAKVRLKAQSEEEWRWIIVLIEIDSRTSLTSARKQVERYYHFLRAKEPSENHFRFSASRAKAARGGGSRAAQTCLLPVEQRRQRQRSDVERSS